MGCWMSLVCPKKKLCKNMMQEPQVAPATKIETNSNKHNSSRATKKTHQPNNLLLAKAQKAPDFESNTPHLCQMDIPSSVGFEVP